MMGHVDAVFICAWIGLLAAIVQPIGGNRGGNQAGILIVEQAHMGAHMDVPAPRGAKAQAQAGGEGGEGSGPAAAAADGAGEEARPSSS
jgi:hypothetical protein